MRTADVLSSIRSGMADELRANKWPIPFAAFLPLRWPWRGPPNLPRPDAFAGKSILLASEGRPIPHSAVEFAGRMAEKVGAEVHVLSIARIWGTSFGLPHPGLLPNKREMQERHESVAAVVSVVETPPCRGEGQVTGTRNAAKRILAEARRCRADAIVMASRPAAAMVPLQHGLVARALSRAPVGACPRLSGD